MQQTHQHYAYIHRVQRWALIIGLVGLVIVAIGAFISQEQFFQSYLLGYLFWVHIALGCFAALMLHHVVGGKWGFVIRRFMESGAMTLPLMALLFIPLVFGLQELYLWTHPELIAESEILEFKTFYLNVPFFLGRAVLYFVVWIGLAYLLNHWSAKQDETAAPGLKVRLQRLSSLGLILYMVTVTFAAFDWMMSLEPEWASSIYGVLFVAGQALVTVAFAIVLARLLINYEPLARWLTPALFNDLGNLLLAFVIFWAYIAFSQYLIIWSGNLPEEAIWYVHRTEGGWQWVAMALIAFHFVLPFLLLLSRRVKRRVQILTTIAVLVIFMRFVDLFWLVVPAFGNSLWQIHWLDFVTLIGLGGIWIAFFAWHLKRRALIPRHDPQFQEATHA